MFEFSSITVAPNMTDFSIDLLNQMVLNDHANEELRQISLDSPLIYAVMDNNIGTPATTPNAGASAEALYFAENITSGTELNVDNVINAPLSVTVSVEQSGIYRFNVIALVSSGVGDCIPTFQVTDIDADSVQEIGGFITSGVQYSTDGGNFFTPSILWVDRWLYGGKTYEFSVTTGLLASTDDIGYINAYPFPPTIAYFWIQAYAGSGRLLETYNFRIPSFDINIPNIDFNIPDLGFEFPDFEFPDFGFPEFGDIGIGGFGLGDFDFENPFEETQSDWVEEFSTLRTPAYAEGMEVTDQMIITELGFSATSTNVTDVTDPPDIVDVAGISISGALTANSAEMYVQPHVTVNWGTPLNSWNHTVANPWPGGPQERIFPEYIAFGIACQSKEKMTGIPTPAEEELVIEARVASWPVDCGGFLKFGLRGGCTLTIEDSTDGFEEKNDLYYATLVQFGESDIVQPLVDGGPVNSGDIFKMVLNGTTINVYHNSDLLITNTFTTFNPNSYRFGVGIHAKGVQMTGTYPTLLPTNYEIGELAIDYVRLGSADIL